MTRILLLALLAVMVTINSHAALSVSPERVSNGGVALLRWQGESLSFGVIRFRDQVIYLYPDAAGAIALIPVGLDVPAGAYRLPAALVDRQGRTTFAEIPLQIVVAQRPVERLSLPERMVTPTAEDLARIERESRLLGQVYSLRSPRLWTDFMRPVNDPVNSVFGKRRILNGKPKAPHSGTDFRSAAGTPVRVLSDGRVAFVGDLFYTGKTVVVDHGEGLISLYAHLSETLVTEGMRLAAGTALGKVGSTGRSTGAHLHLTVRLLGERIDPMALLALFEE